MCVAAAGLLGVISTVASVAGTAVGVVGGMQAAKAEAAASEYQAKQSRIMAEDALKRGAAEEQAQRRKTSALEGRQRAVMAASGLDIGSGSPLSILADTAQLGELDAQTVRANANREAQQYNSQATLYSAQAKSQKSAGILGAMGTALGGAQTLADKWYRPAVRKNFATQQMSTAGGMY